MILYVSTKQLVYKETEKIRAQNIEIWYEAWCKVHNQEFTAFYMIPGQAYPALHEEMSKLFTASHVPRQPGSTRVSRRVPRVGEVWKVDLAIL
jgi:hypothetical protein